MNEETKSTTDVEWGYSVLENIHWPKFAIQIAARFAARSHHGQVRKYTGEPYIHHPEEVALLVEVTGGTPWMVQAAWLHDVQEACGVSNEHIAARFGPIVARYVNQLTDVSTPADGNRSARKALDLAHIAEADPEVKTIKLADLISNYRSIVRHDPKFARIYMVEKAQQIGVLKEGNQSLLRIAQRIIRDYASGIQPLDMPEGLIEAGGEMVNW